MKFLIHNTTTEVKSICRFGGTKVNILPNDYIEFEPNNSLESNYWANISRTNSISGLNVIVDTIQQGLIKKLKRAGKLTSTNINTKSIITNTVESVLDKEDATVEEVIESTVEQVLTVEETVNEPINNEPLPEIENVEEIISDEQIFDNVVEEVVTTDDNAVDNTIDETIEPTTEDNVEVETEATDNDVEDVETTVESDNIDTTDETTDFVKYSEEELNNMTKAELQEVLNTLGVSYRKNNTNATLVNLILEYYNSED